VYESIQSSFIVIFFFLPSSWGEPLRLGKLKFVFEGNIDLKMKILLSITHPHVVPKHTILTQNEIFCFVLAECQLCYLVYNKTILDHCIQ